MDPVLTTGEIVGFLGAAIVLSIVAGIAQQARRLAAAEGRGGLRFHRVLRLAGVDASRLIDEPTLRSAATSVRRCLSCRQQAECDAWLADRGRKGVAPPLCPNASFFETLTRS